MSAVEDLYRFCKEHSLPYHPTSPDRFVPVPDDLWPDFEAHAEDVYHEMGRPALRDEATWRAGYVNIIIKGRVWLPESVDWRPE
jgi:hypothetical protein